MMVITLDNILKTFGAIACIGGGLAYIIKLINAIRTPNVKQNTILEEHSKQLKKHEEYFENDNDRITELEEQDRLVMQALFALLSHGIDGNDIEAMKQCKENIQKYLILK